MLGNPVELSHLKTSNKLPYVFDEDDIQEVFFNITNIKHLAILQIALFAGLRASEITNLDDSDINLVDRTVRVRGGKGDKDAMLFLTEDCVKTLTEYLKRRPKLKVDGRYPHFYTYRGARYNRRMIYNIFRRCKEAAGIDKRGEIHVFSRHSSATLLLRRGADLLTVKELTRHKSINTTERDLHLADADLRAKYDQYLKV
jgi:integrase/recombinase XerD